LKKRLCVLGKTQGRFTLNALAFESKRLGVFESRLRGLFLRENTIKEERQLIVLDKLPFFLSG
jgi:hypothetical protein